ncbi:hypothetical protein HY68_38020 [Streptomyces sp. AcH 505]|uniref:hypothetical protein n=1 Tax=Streptomyces sp. AcH 505 TaxID=352211 RepID=UPI000591F24C|nr:hypothetical protein HY68_38020 [Streptomyces sp. AcH 505]
MKVLAIASIKAPLTPEQRQQIMPQEVPATLKLYLNGTIEQMWFRDQAGPVFLMNAESVAQAKTAIDALPLMVADLATYEYMPLSPLMPLGMLIQGK